VGLNRTGENLCGGYRRGESPQVGVKWGKMERRSRRTFWWFWMGRGQPGRGSPVRYRGGGHGSSSPTSSSEVGKGRLGLGASEFRKESI